MIQMWHLCFSFTRRKQQSGANIESFSFSFLSLFGVEFRSYWENICLLARISFLLATDTCRANLLIGNVSKHTNPNIEHGPAFVGCCVSLKIWPKVAKKVYIHIYDDLA